MANMKEVNKALKKAYPKLDASGVRGEGYVYFVGYDGEEMNSIYVNPTSTSTEELTRLVLEEAADLMER